MPDLERFSRKLKLDLAETSEKKAYVKGKHAGQDEARMQIIILVLSILAVYLFVI